jgi:transposase
MMGRQDRDQRQLFYEFSLDEMIPTDHLLRRINGFATAVLADLHQQLKGFYSEIGRPSVDPELMIRMLLVGYCYGIRHERRLCQEVALHLAYRWFCKLDLDDKVPHHSTFSVNRLGRFRESEILRHIFERVVAACMVAGLVKGEGFAVDASVMEANASRYHGKAPNELDWTDAQRQKRAVAEYLAGLEAETQAQEDGASRGGGSDGQPTAAPDRKPPKVISPCVQLLVRLFQFVSNLAEAGSKSIRTGMRGDVVAGLVRRERVRDRPHPIARLPPFVAIGPDVPQRADQRRPIAFQQISGLVDRKQALHAPFNLRTFVVAVP